MLIRNSTASLTVRYVLLNPSPVHHVRIRQRAFTSATNTLNADNRVQNQNSNNSSQTNNTSETNNQPLSYTTKPDSRTAMASAKRAKMK